MSQDGDARRFCGVCDKSVHDLSALTESQARAVLDEESTKGRVCVRYKADGDGNIKFKLETVTASSLWRTTLAAAGMTLALLTGCTEGSPERVLDDHCEYEVGPWGFSAARGQGTCPAVEPESEPEPEPCEVVGQAMIEPPPPQPEFVKQGEAPPPEPRPLMGKPAPREVEVKGGLQPERERELKGDVIYLAGGDGPL